VDCRDPENGLHRRFRAFSILAAVARSGLFFGPYS
jgi:hypothetical protein